jgi:glycosyltransferase involved in cell wall biosynthesis
LKVVIVVPFQERVGGAENRLYRFLRHVDRERVDPMLVFLGAGSLEGEVRELGFATQALPTRRLRRGGKFFSTVRRLRGIFEREHPDVILNWGNKAQIVGSPAASLAGFADRVAWWQLGVPPGKLDSRLATLLPARAVACSSHYVARAQRRQRPRRATFVVHPGIDPPGRLSGAELDRERTVLSIPADRPIIGTVGRLETLKRQDILIRAVSTLRRGGHDVHGLIVGGDAYKIDPWCQRRLERLVVELGLTDAVTFTGQVPDPARYLQLMDVFALTTPTEGFGIALVEALGAGVASVAVDAAGQAEIIEHEESGYLVPSPDEVQFAGAIERLLTDDALRRRLAEGGRIRQRVLFSADRMATELEDRLLEIGGESS